MQSHTFIKAAASLVIVLLTSALSLAQANASNTPRERAAQISSQGRPRFIKAFVIDDRLSALRREPGAQSQIINRLRLGRAVYIVNWKRVESSGSAYYKIAASRRTRGWMHEGAIAVAGRSGDDRRVMALIESADEELDRITLCRLLIENFGSSKLVPRALLRLGQEAERAAEALSRRAKKRLADIGGLTIRASLSDYYLNDSGLDRYSRLRVVFNFNEPAAEYIYDGRAYNELIRRFPDNEEARIARERLEIAQQKLSRQK